MATRMRWTSASMNQNCALRLVGQFGVEPAELIGARCQRVGGGAARARAATRSGLPLACRGRSAGKWARTTRIGSLAASAAGRRRVAAGRGHRHLAVRADAVRLDARAPKLFLDAARVDPQAEELHEPADRADDLVEAVRLAARPRRLGCGGTPADR
ncbi:hypothetical protein [Micromonospora sp. NPDC007230]|uniref:hypothetical protein n=1 Tax=Micromonospora sp. NPDC007230 TaxID=3364237 RepID=UPI00368E21E0